MQESWKEFIVVGLSATIITLVLPTPPGRSVALAQTACVQAPFPPDLPQPLHPHGPDWCYVDESDCDIELEFSHQDFPVPVRFQERIGCPGMSPVGAPYGVYSIHLAAQNGYLVEGEGSMRNFCNTVLQRQESVDDGVIATLSTVGVPGGPPPVGVASVESDPDAGVYALTDGLGVAELQVWHEVTSTATDCDRLLTAFVRSAYTLGPSAGATLGVTAGAFGVTAGIFMGGSATVVAGQGTQRADLHVLPLEDRQSAVQESTRVWAKERLKVWARGTSMAPCGSYAAAFVERWNPYTRSQLECGGDDDHNGTQDTYLVVEW